MITTTPLIVYKGRTNTVLVDLQYDVSGDVITSEIRTQPEISSHKIATWNVSFASDGTDGKLILTLDNSITSVINDLEGYMDLKRVSSGEPIPVFESPLQVLFRGSVTE